ncbi:hypothetical protein [Sphingobium sp. EM0848]|uniref:hypothetical protein n=1 Tax=Sphingobium sp. EM0848 TaxID=2743473 RepID=UPI00159BFEC7|nr:hypothetical protein [Sphingobium sp. EM0848]
MRRFATLLTVMAALAASPLHAQENMAGMHHAFPRTIGEWANGARIFDGMGSFHRPAGTNSAEAQAYFDQGMRFLWAFNHDEAARSFARATVADPACAMCFWGVALSLGPNYNMMTMADIRAQVGWQALEQARSLAPRAPNVDRALIEALARRFDGTKGIGPANGPPLLRAYADAMRTVANAYPDDIDVQVMFAEALMNLNPWKLWDNDGRPAPGTAEIVSTLERALARNPEHPGANHYYIHAIEASNAPDKGITAAERVGAMMPAAGHLVHMPSHIMQRVGRYEASAEANRRAAQSDEAYYKQTAAIDYYPMYSAHNLQFLAAAASMEGREAETMAALHKVRTVMSDDMVAGMAGSDWILGFSYDAMIRFGRWEAMIAEPMPDPRLKGLMIAYLADRAQAFAALGRLAEARTELTAAEKATAAMPADATAAMNAGKPLYEIALLRARARIAQAEGNRTAEIALLTEAVGKEDSLSYDEPSDEFFPTRHLLGAALLAAGQTAQAETVYREDLKRNPANGWALQGLALALEQQGKGAEAARTRADFEAAWRRADRAIASSAF